MPSLPQGQREVHRVIDDDAKRYRPDHDRARTEIDAEQRHRTKADDDREQVRDHRDQAGRDRTQKQHHQQRDHAERDEEAHDLSVDDVGLHAADDFSLPGQRDVQSVSGKLRIDAFADLRQHRDDVARSGQWNARRDACVTEVRTDPLAEHAGMRQAVDQHRGQHNGLR